MDETVNKYPCMIIHRSSQQNESYRILFFCELPVDRNTDNDLTSKVSSISISIAINNSQIHLLTLSSQLTHCSFKATLSV